MDIQPGGDASTPPAAEPAAPVTPPAAEPAAPVTPPEPAAPPADNQPTEAEQAEAKEWEAAEDELFPGIKAKREEQKKDEPEKPAETPPAPEAPKDGEAGDQPPKPADEGEPKGDEENEEEVPEFDSAAYDARKAQRAAQQDHEAIVADVRKQLYPDLPQELRDADGDPIKGIPDVMKLVNPRTGKAFTEEEAGSWLLAAQQQFNQRMSDISKQVDSIATIYSDLKDQADAINYRYGNILKEMPDLKDRLWARYQNTLVKDEKSGIILHAPLSLEEFYETALEPYAVKGQELEAEEAKKVADEKAAAEAEAKAKAEAEAKKKAERQDRSDIYGGGSKDDARTEDDKEWGSAIDTVFGDELNRRNNKK